MNTIQETHTPRIHQANTHVSERLEKLINLNRRTSASQFQFSKQVLSKGLCADDAIVDAILYFIRRATTVHEIHC